MDESLPAFAHRVTVLGSTRKSAATSAGVSSVSASGERVVMFSVLLARAVGPPTQPGRMPGSVHIVPCPVALRNHFVQMIPHPDDASPLGRTERYQRLTH